MNNHTEICFSLVDELPDSVEMAECKLESSCNENPSLAPTSANRKVPTNWSSEGIVSGFQTITEDPLAGGGWKSASNDSYARAEANAEDMYQLELRLKELFPVTESACWRKVANDLSTTSFDYAGNKSRPKNLTRNRKAHG